MDVVLVLIMFIYFLLSMFDYLLNSKLDLIQSYGYYNPNGLDVEF